MHGIGNEAQTDISLGNEGTLFNCQQKKEKKVGKLGFWIQPYICINQEGYKKDGEDT